MTTLDMVMGLESKATSYVDRLVSMKGWRWKCSLLCGAVVLFFSFPSLDLLIHRDPESTWNVVFKQADHPLTPIQVEDETTHNAKRTFRLFVPLMCNITGIRSVYVVYALQIIVGFLFYYCALRLAEKATGSRSMAVITALALCFIYGGQLPFTDVFAKFDGIAITYLLAAMCFRNPLLILLFCVAASWTDERAYIATSFVFIWWKVQDPKLPGLKTLIIPDLRSGAVLIAMISYPLGRYLLQTKFGFHPVTSDLGPHVLLKQVNMVLYGLWSAFEGLWVVVIVALLDLLRRKEIISLGLVLAATAISFAVALFVIDITRSLAFCVPVIFITLSVLNRSSDQPSLQRLLFFALLTSAIVPTYFAEGAFRVEGTNPALFKLVDLFR